MRPLHDSVTKETAEARIIKLSVFNNKTVSLLKSGEISLIEAENEANNELLASFSTKSCGISAIFTRHPNREKVSLLM